MSLMRVLGRVLPVLWVVVAGVWQASAQGSDPAIVSHSAEVAFPSAVRFEAVVDAPAGVSVAVLTLQQDEQMLFEGVVEPQSLQEGAGTVRLVFDWPIPLSAPPRLFAHISYAWLVQVAGSEALEVNGVVTFQPGGTEWRIGGEPPLNFAVGDSLLNLTAARQAVMPAYELLAQQVGATPEFKWIVLPASQRFCKEIVDEQGAAVLTVGLASDATAQYPCSEEGAAEMIVRSGWPPLYRDSVGLLRFEDEVVDALFDAFYNAELAGQRWPAWFRDGLRQYYHVNPDPLGIRQVQDAARASTLYDASALERGPATSDRDGLWARQTRALVLYLADQHGAWTPFELARQGLTGSFEGALVDVAGANLEQLAVGFERWIFTESAVRAVVWTPYAKETPTPLPTRMQSPLPPVQAATPSLAATHTAIPSPIPTQTMARTITVLPTVEALSPTLPPATTNTPRPPGSLGLDQGGNAAGPVPGTGLCPATLPALLLPVLGLSVIRQRKKPR